MIPHREDPERPALLDMRKLRLDQCWRKGEIGDSTYLRSLFIVGVLPRDAVTELNLLKLEKPISSANRATLERIQNAVRSKMGNQV